MNSTEFHIEFEKRLLEVEKMMNSTNKASVLFILQVPDDNSHEILLPYTRESLSNIICFVEISDEKEINYILQRTINIIDRVVIDIDRKRKNSDIIIKTIQESITIPYFLYSDLKMWADASINFILQTTNNIYESKILLVGHSFLTTRVLLNLIGLGIQVYMFESDYNNGIFEYDFNNKIEIYSKQINLLKELNNKDKVFDILLGTSLKEKYNNLDEYVFGAIYDIGLKNFSPDYIKNSIDKNIEVYRFDNRAGVSSIILNLMETEYLVKYNMGRSRINSINIVSGGIMGKEGDIVVDSIQNPNAVLGVANGSGIFKHDNELTGNDNENLSILKKLIY